MCQPLAVINTCLLNYSEILNYNLLLFIVSSNEVLQCPFKQNVHASRKCYPATPVPYNLHSEGASIWINYT